MIDSADGIAQLWNAGRDGLAQRKTGSKSGTLRKLYERMLLIRKVELQLSAMVAESELPGFIHVSVGQEAVAVGVVAPLRDSDTVASTHRGHGHALAKGMDLDRFFLEIMGKDEGVCGGRGGSMHVADMAVGMLGANGIVGAGIPIALGSALAHQVRKTGGVAVSFFGDGALAGGVLHESLNLAALWRLPLLFVCENNGWAEFAETARQFAGDVGTLGAAFGIPAERVDGNDVEAVAAASRRAVSAMRRSGGPRLIECVTRRAHGHYEGDRQNYRDDKERESWHKHDPIALCERRLRKSGVSKTDLEAVADPVDRRIGDAVAKARAGRSPAFEAVAADVYTPGPGA